MALLKWYIESYTKVATTLAVWIPILESMEHGGETIDRWTMVGNLSKLTADELFRPLDNRSSLASMVAHVADECRKLGLKSPVKLAERMVKQMDARGPAPTYRDLIVMAMDLKSRMEDELDSVRLFRLSGETAEYYGQPTLFGQEVADHFRAAVYDN